MKWRVGNGKRREGNNRQEKKEGGKKEREVVRGAVRETKGEETQCQSSQKVKHFQKRQIDSKDSAH